MKLITIKNLSSTLSFIFHLILFAAFLLFFHPGADIQKAKYVEVGFAGNVESNSPGSPGSGADESKPPPEKEVNKPEKPLKEKKEIKKRDEISDKTKPSKEQNPQAANTDTAAVKSSSTGGLATGSGNPGSGGTGNGQPGSGPPKKGLLIPTDIYFVAVDQMPVPIGGMESIKARAFYPPEAKAKNIGGTVYVLAFIDERGFVRRTNLIKGIGHGCDQSAVRAVKDTRFEPGMLHGVPVKVQMTIAVNFYPGMSN